MYEEFGTELSPGSLVRDLEQVLVEPGRHPVTVVVSCYQGPRVLDEIHSEQEMVPLSQPATELAQKRSPPLRGEVAEGAPEEDHQSSSVPRASEEPSQLAVEVPDEARDLQARVLLEEPFRAPPEDALAHVERHVA